MPLVLRSNTRARGVTITNRLSTILFGSPNWRRAFGIVSTAGEGVLIAQTFTNAMRRFFHRPQADWHRPCVPVFSVDRMGSAFFERLPRIWLSERVGNTRCDDGRRIMVECYPQGADECGVRALELAERYIGEGMDAREVLSHREQCACFQAAEILLMHAIARGSRNAAALLAALYREDRCHGAYWQPFLVKEARHARKRMPIRRKNVQVTHCQVCPCSSLFSLRRRSPRRFSA